MTGWSPRAAGGRRAGGARRAQELLEQGNRLFRDGDKREALARYRQAYDVFASPKLFFNIARCEESLGDRTGAIRDFGYFLDGAPERPRTRAPRPASASPR